MRHDDSSQAIDINKLRISILSSKEYLIGRKILTYVRLCHEVRIREIFKQITNDFRGIRKIARKQQLRDFENKKLNAPGKIVIYSAVFGEYDSIREPLFSNRNIEYLMFTDQIIPDGSVWKAGDLSRIPKDCDSFQKKNRYVKMFPEKLFDADFSIYVDGNLQCIGDLSVLIQEDIRTCKTGMAMHLHPRNVCVYEEAYTAWFQKKITKNERNIILKKYEAVQLPKNYGMFECNVIVRDHSNNLWSDIMKNWWKEYIEGVKRDQLHLVYVLYRMGYQFDDIVNFGASVNSNPYFIRYNHLV